MISQRANVVNIFYKKNYIKSIKLVYFTAKFATDEKRIALKLRQFFFAFII